MPLYPIDAESHLTLLSSNLVKPRPRECLACFIERMVEEFGCNSTLRWATAWRDERAPRATRLEDRLQRRGAFCDCEVTINAYVLQAEMQMLAPGQYDAEGRYVAPAELCFGVSRSDSTQPCALWLAE